MMRSCATAGLADYPALQRFPNGREGGLMKLVAEVVGLDEGERVLDGAIYLIDPVDPSSVFPEAAALKRQCVIHGKPFISTVASARDWIEMERIHAGFAPDPGADVFHQLESRTLALIAHDAMKPQMLAFAAEHFDLLSRYAQRVATGTTGQRPQRTGLESRLAGGPGLGAALPERADGWRRADRRAGAGATLPPRDLLRGPARGAPARSRYPAARAGRHHAYRRSGVHHLAAGGGALGRRGPAACGAAALRGGSGAVCLIAFAWHSHPRWRLLLAGNRDEFHARPSAALARWDDLPIIGGRDLRGRRHLAGCDRCGRCCVVTNVRDPRDPQLGVSRGMLATDYLAGDVRCHAARPAAAATAPPTIGRSTC